MKQLAFLMHKSFQGRFRVKEFIPFFKKHGVEVELVRVSEDMISRYRNFKHLSNFDMVIVQRKLLSPIDLFFVRHFAKKMIFDFDDAIMYRSSRHGNHHSWSKMKKFKAMMIAVDGVIAGNTYLKNEAAKFISPEKIYVIPTIVDLKEYSIKNYDTTKKDFIIGWIGTSGNLHYLKSIAPALEKLNKKYKNIKLKIVCDRFFDLNNIEVIKKIWRPEDVEQDLKSFDVGVMPIKDDLWARGKCGLKVVQYLAAGVPAVVSPVGLNKDLAIPDKTGFWANDIEDWTDKISQLVDHPNKRMKMGLAGRKLVQDKYSLQTQAPRYLAILKKITSGGI
ncbi:MAG: glycosyltransferase family 4 protein [Thermodesulfobacteriota bacterium]|nr:glycosyltransferase family 4 protein [Thermodesulfobacteriota bacterium]